jgi:hypothetical protein
MHSSSKRTSHTRIRGSLDIPAHQRTVTLSEKATALLKLDFELKLNIDQTIYENDAHCDVLTKIIPLMKKTGLLNKTRLDRILERSDQLTDIATYFEKLAPITEQKFDLILGQFYLISQFPGERTNLLAKLQDTPEIMAASHAADKLCGGFPFS